MNYIHKNTEIKKKIVYLSSFVRAISSTTVRDTVDECHVELESLDVHDSFKVEHTVVEGCLLEEHSRRIDVLHVERSGGIWSRQGRKRMAADREKDMVKKQLRMVVGLSSLWLHGKR